MKLESFDRTGANTEDSVPLPVIKEAFTIDLNDLSPPIIYEKYSYMVIRLLNIIPYKEDKVDQQVDFDLLGTFQEDITDALITNLRNVYSPSPWSLSMRTEYLANPETVKVHTILDLVRSHY